MGTIHVVKHLFAHHITARYYFFMLAQPLPGLVLQNKLILVSASIIDNKIVRILLQYHRHVSKILQSN